MIRQADSCTVMCVAAIAVSASSIGASPGADASEPASSIELLGVIRDFPPQSQHPDFLAIPSATPGTRSAQNVALMLDADNKPVYVGGGKRVNQDFRDAGNNQIAWCAPGAAGDVAGTFTSNDSGGVGSASTFAQWFRDVPGSNMSGSWAIVLQRDLSGTYIYDVSDFHPIDYQLLGNGPDAHNYYFTYEISCTFTSAPGQFITFTGDDDCWIFINDRLAIDHGGIAAGRRQHFTLDRLLLTSGQTYELRIFFAERCQPQSQFRLETNIDSLTSSACVAVLNATD